MFPFGIMTGVVSVKETPSRKEHLVEHRLRQQSGLRVPLARVVRGEHGDGREGPHARVTELWLRHGQFASGRPPGSQERIHGNGAQHDHDTKRRKEKDFPLQIRLAPGKLGLRRLVLRRGASHRRGDVAVTQPQAVVSRDGRRLVRESDAVERAIQPVSASVAREYAPCPVPSVRSGGETDDQEAGVRVAEPRNGSPPILPLAERRALRAGDRFAVPHKARALAALDDFRGESPETFGRQWLPEARDRQKLRALRTSRPEA